jgi:DNA-binding beta-propeller fold protein YncE
MVSALVGTCFSPATASADAPYKTYTMDGYGSINETQTAYMPYSSITKVGEEALNAPTDMMIKDDLLYIADTGNRRIIVSTLDGDYVREFGSDVLVYPSGVFVMDDGRVYVADRDAKSVFVFDSEGNVVNTYGKPDSIMYGDDMEFKPQKITVNSAGTMYIICEGNTNGIVEISPADGGTFLGYFGTNETHVTVTQVIQRMVFSAEMRAKMVSNRPATPGNLAIDEKGLIYTVTQGEKLGTLKRLNIAGTNMIDPEAYDENPVAVVAGNYDNVYVASSRGYIYEFNNEGDMLFVFGGADDGRSRIGLSTNVQAIDVDSNDRVYTLDSEKAQVQIFEPTEFTNLLHEALYLYSKGRYTESKEPLTQVLTMNSLFDYANKAMGRALQQEENYEEAIKYAKIAKDYDGYSDAFWEIRNVWLNKNLVPAIVIIVLLVVIWKLIAYFDKKKGILAPVHNFNKKIKEKKLMQQLTYGMYFMKHPIDGCYGVRREKKASYLAANILIFIFILYNIISKYFCGFLMKTVREGRYEIVTDVGVVVVVFAFAVICNYLVCTINDGEGTVKQIYCSFVYCLTPYFFLQPIVFVLSHVLTYNEYFLIQFVNILMYVWIVILIVLAIKEINNYTMKETAKVIFLTFFTALIGALLIFIIYVLWMQVFDFISAICGEAVYRFGK